MNQLEHSVQWQLSVENMIKSGVSTFIEIGSGNVLSGLIKRIDKNVKVLNVSNTSDLKNISG
jgi:[acyl-carrier-protein] S-malonyltransferase